MAATVETSKDMMSSQLESPSLTAQEEDTVLEHNGHGQLKRGLKSRHIQFIALGGCIGTGLFLGIGSALATSGPLSIFLGYTLTGVAVYAMMNCLGEMATWLPLPGAVPHYCHRYVDPALGFAVGWNNWITFSLTLCAEMSAAAVLIQFWNTTINPAVWITILWALIISLNVFAVSIYGEAEFIFASIKIISILGLLLLSLIIDLGGGPNHDRLGFRYWHHPYEAMLEVVAEGNTGRFLGLFSTLINAAFSYGSAETVAIAAGEAANPRRNIPKAVRRVVWRILFFYVLGSLAIGVTVPANDPRLLSGGAGVHSSPFVIAIYRAGIPVLPSIINAVVITSAASSGNAMLYNGSRYLYALAQNGHAPAFFLNCTKRGVPIWCVAITAAIGPLAYLSASAGASEVFGWFLVLVTVSSLLTWISVQIAYLRFVAALKAQGVDRRTLVFRCWGQPYTAWAALAFFVLIVLFNGWKVFTSGNWATRNFISSYLGLPVFFCLYIGWKLWKRTSFVKAQVADIWTGKAELDAIVWPDETPKNMMQSVWCAIA